MAEVTAAAVEGEWERKEGRDRRHPTQQNACQGGRYQQGTSTLSRVDR